MGPATALAAALAARAPAVAGDLELAGVLLGAAGAVPPPDGVSLDLGALADPAAVAKGLAESLGLDALASLQAEGERLGLAGALAQARTALDP